MTLAETLAVVTQQELLNTARKFLDDPAVAQLLKANPTERAWVQLFSDVDLQVWAIAWPTGTSTGWHDHSGASGAFVVAAGGLTEHSWLDGEHVTQLPAGVGKSFSSSHIHNVLNNSDKLAVSVHAYSPSLTSMTRYEIVDGKLTIVGVDRAGDAW